MVMRGTVIAFGIAAIGVWSAERVAAGDVMFGCQSRPACSKVCKLVCETETLVVVGYGCECDTIAIPGPSRDGCKHCATVCGCASVDQGCPPKIEFCWRDWFACGCAKPRTVKVLTKFAAEKEICSYHWEVVDAGCCSCPAGGCGRTCEPNCPCVYKPAPPDVELGDVLAVTPVERAQLVIAIAADANDIAASLAAANVAARQPPAAEATPLAESAPQSRPSPRIRLAAALGLSPKAEQEAGIEIDRSVGP